MYFYKYTQEKTFTFAFFYFAVLMCSAHVLLMHSTFLPPSEIHENELNKAMLFAGMFGRNVELLILWRSAAEHTPLSQTKTSVSWSGCSV